MRKACVIGWPVAHSLSPVIHGHWLRELGIDGQYCPEAVVPDRLGDFLSSLSDRGYYGANVTVPHKIQTYRLCERRDEAAEAIGAVNTLWFERGRLTGSNTDAFGFAANLDSEAKGWDRLGPAVVIGAGGAARAIVWALLQRNIDDIRIVNRTAERAEELAAAFRPARAFAFKALPSVLEGAGLIVNASTLGMGGQPPLEINLSAVGKQAVVCDIVYHPLETGLLAQARTRGLIAVDGLGMLLYQAVPGFERWFGVRPEVTPALRSAVLDAVAARESERQRP
jgi:shikimate dehydrogenase